MKTTFKTILSFILMTSFANAQDVSYKDIDFKHRKESLIVNKQNVFKLKYSAGYFYVYDLNTNEEIMYFYMNHNETLAHLDDDYIKVYFTKSKKSFETKTHQRIIMERLINEKVISSDWKIDESKIDDFVAKYDENISNRTRR